jgi:hypothetical protein
MDILFSFEEEQIQKSVRKFTKTELLPNDREIDEKGQMSKKTEKKFKEMSPVTVPKGYTEKYIFPTNIKYLLRNHKILL